jgi:hypothetical protein
MKHNKRPQYVTDLVEKANKRFRDFKIKDESNDLFVFVCDYLLKRNMYEGYNFYKDEYVHYVDKVVSVLAGSAKKEEYDYLQIY